MNGHVRTQRPGAGQQPDPVAELVQARAEVGRDGVGDPLVRRDRGAQLFVGQITDRHDRGRRVR